ncbi:hypothetical protein [Paenibacillus glacialis]|uniref:Uncharacterized protein n=1 Tax=Paenibacillus glacialis TaxID=494026 RepID=A0A168N8G7_9BACL|nr:hypothetical protein [Paenibacillus glacialis]OAB45516.1 hypothetical protein PGLA_04500 [Paenibacillus glacialis]
MTLDDEDKLSVMPQLFKLMSPEMANLKYPSGRRPDHIFTNVEGTVNMAFTYTNTAVDETEIEDFTIEMAKILRKTQKLQKWYGDGVKEHSIPIGYCEFLSPTITLNVYNLMFFVSLDDRAVLCTFNCLDVEMEDWKPAAHQMMASTKIQGGDHV